MKKKLLSLICFLAIISSAEAQIGFGVNTDNPKGIFHVDGQGNTDASNITTDDIIFTNEGKMGIGTITPAEVLDVVGKAKNTGNLTTNNLLITNNNKGLIKGKTATSNLISNSTSSTLEIKSMQVNDPTLTPNKYATTDGDGSVYWDYQRTDSKVVGLDATTGKLKALYNSEKRVHKVNGTDTDNDITDNSLILSKGKWLIICKYVCRSDEATGGGGDESKNGTDMLVWASIRAKETSTPGTFTLANSSEKVRYGFKPESSGWNVVTPQFTYLANITEETEFKVFSLISVNTPIYRTLDSFGGSLFVAIRLDDK